MNLEVRTVLVTGASRGLQPARVSTAHILGCGTLVTLPDNRNSRNGGMARGPQVASRSIADGP
jgi:hypothetical protein